VSAAIHTRYGSGARGSHIRAWTKDGKADMALRLPYPHEMHHSRRHAAAAKALAEKLGWSGLWIVGHNDDTRSNVPAISCAQLPGSYSRAWVDRYIAGAEGEDWFFIPEPVG
jgi:hypothetical protein